MSGYPATMDELLQQEREQPRTRPCSHDWVTSTVKLGPHCADCKEPLAGLFRPISRNTPTGALIYAMRTTQGASHDQ